MTRTQQASTAERFKRARISRRLSDWPVVRRLARPSFVLVRELSAGTRGGLGTRRDFSAQIPVISGGIGTIIEVRKAPRYPGGYAESTRFRRLPSKPTVAGSNPAGG